MSEVILDRIATTVTATARTGERFDNFAPTRYIQIVKAPVAFTIHLNQSNGESIDVPAGATGPIQICDPDVELIDKIFLDIPAGTGEIVMLSSPNLKVDFNASSTSGLSPRRMWSIVPGTEAGPINGIKAGILPAFINESAGIPQLFQEFLSADANAGTDWFDALGFLAWTIVCNTAATDYRVAQIFVNHQVGYPIGEILSNNAESVNVDIGGQHWVMGGSFRAEFDARAANLVSAHFFGFGTYNLITGSDGIGEGGFIGFLLEEEVTNTWKAVVLDYNGGAEVRTLDKVLTGLTGTDTLHDFRIAYGWRKGGAPFVQWIANGSVVHEQAGHSLAVEAFPGIGWRPICGVTKKGQTDAARLYTGMRGGWFLDHYAPDYTP